MFFKEASLPQKKLIGVLIGFVGIVAINANIDVISKKVFQSVKPIASTGIYISNK